jgi:hypothetical protein
MTDMEKALLGAIEMLDKIAHQESFNVIEYHERMNRYKATMLKAQPALKADPYFKKFFN